MRRFSDLLHYACRTYRYVGCYAEFIMVIILNNACLVDVFDLFIATTVSRSARGVNPRTRQKRACISLKKPTNRLTSRKSRENIFPRDYSFAGKHTRVRIKFPHCSCTRVVRSSFYTRRVRIPSLKSHPKKKKNAGHRRREFFR